MRNRRPARFGLASVVFGAVVMTAFPVGLATLAETPRGALGVVRSVSWSGSIGSDSRPLVIALLSLLGWLAWLRLCGVFVVEVVALLAGGAGSEAVRNGLLLTLVAPRARCARARSARSQNPVEVRVAVQTPAPAVPTLDE